MKKEKTYTYNQIAFPLLFVSVVALFLASTWNMENQIKDLQNENNSLDYALKFQKEQCQYHVQDLMLKIDSLEKELIFYEPQSVGETIDLINITKDITDKRHKTIVRQKLAFIP